MPLATLFPALLLDHLLRITMLPNSIGPSVCGVVLLYHNVVLRARCHSDCRDDLSNGSVSGPNVGFNVVARDGHGSHEDCPSKNSEACEEFRFVSSLSATPA
jgi:hypothetical protein